MEVATVILVAGVNVEEDALCATSGGKSGIKGLDDQIAAQVIAQTLGSQPRTGYLSRTPVTAGATTRISHPGQDILDLKHF